MPGAKLALTRDPSPKLAQRFKQRITHGHFVRFHMGLILAAVVASGVLMSKALLEIGVHSLRLRYPLAVLGSYCVFLLLVRVWVWYVSIRRAAFFDLGVLDFGSLDAPGGSGGGSAAPFRFGGGDSGGAGATDSWGSEMTSVSAPETPGSSGSLLPSLDLDFDLGDDGWLVVLLLAALVLGIVCAGGYLVYAAPQILPEAAWQAVLATALTRVSKEAHHGWMAGVLRSTALPFAGLLILAFGLGWAAHRHCPEAARLIDVLACSSL